MHFTFITRSFTPVNLPTIKDNIRDIFKDSEHTYTHIILADLTHEDQRGQSFDNLEDGNTIVRFTESKLPEDTQNCQGMDEAIATVKDDDYIYVLDDDNILHPDFLTVAQYCNGEDAIVFKLENISVLGNPDMVKGDPMGKVDWANFVSKASTMKKLKVYPGGHRCEDGMYFRRMMADNCTFRFVDKVLAYYNKLPRQRG
jgi:hypothetical protein